MDLISHGERFWNRQKEITESCHKGDGGGIHRTIRLEIDGGVLVVSATPIDDCRSDCNDDHYDSRAGTPDAEAE